MSSFAKQCVFFAQKACQRKYFPSLSKSRSYVSQIADNEEPIVNNSLTKKEIAPKNILALHKRGILEDMFPPASVNLPEKLKTKQCFYCGFDPTADSLHIGNLLSLMTLLHCQRAGHEVVVVIGTGTIKAGDPSGHTKDRKSFNQNELNENASKIANCIQRIFDNHEENIYENRLTKNLPPFRILYNHEWYDDLSAIDFISQVCRKFRVGPMIEKRYIQDRINSKEGLSLAEFVYQVLQGYDWMYLNKNYDCSFQIGGIDQLGNITAGYELLRRENKTEIYGLVTPLVTSPKGEKLGKSAGNSVWLCPHKTSPFEFYQYFYRQPDSVVEKFLKYFTFIDLKMIENIMMEHSKRPEKRQAQATLARNICKIVHGEDGLRSAELCTRVLYEGKLDDIETLRDDEIDTVFSGTNLMQGILEPDTTVYDLAAHIAKAVPIGNKGTNVILDGGVRINGQIADNPHQILMPDTHILKNDLTLVTVGKRRHFVVRWKLPRLKSEEEEKGELPPNQAIPGVDIEKLARGYDPE